MIRCLILLLFVSFQLHAAEAEPLSRMYGYMIGDTLEQRIALTTNDKTIELSEQPLKQRVGPWVQRLSSEVSLDEQGKSWLTLRYQVINAPSAPEEVALPALELTTRSGAPFNVSPQTFSLIPLTLERKSSNNNLPFMLPDRVPTLAGNQGNQKNLRYALIALASTLLFWLAWWLWLRQSDKTTLPFSKAMHQLRQLKSHNNQSVNDNNQAWTAVHEAFNSLAGQTLTSQTAQTQLNSRPWLKPFSSDIGKFYESSDKRFFQPGTDADPFELFKFCKTLYKAEKQNRLETTAGSVN